MAKFRAVIIDIETAMSLVDAGSEGKDRLFGFRLWKSRLEPCQWKVFRVPLWRRAQSEDHDLRTGNPSFQRCLGGKSTKSLGNLIPPAKYRYQSYFC